MGMGWRPAAATLCEPYLGSLGRAPLIDIGEEEEGRPGRSLTRHRWWKGGGGG